MGWGGLWIGRAIAANDVHAHHAVQVALALEGSFRFQSPEDGVWLDCTGAVIAPNHPHAFDGRNAPTLAHLFVEPQSLPGRILLRRFPAPNGICLIDGPLFETAAQHLAVSYRASREPANLIAAAREVGLAFRPYVLWLRLKQAVEAFAAGESLTSAAYQSGFADSAHLSHTFRRMYGMAAATLQLE